MDPFDSGRDPVGALKGLAVFDLDSLGARRVRERALARMASGRRRAGHRAGLLAAFCGRILAPALVAGLSFGFAAWAVARSIGVLQQARGGFFLQ